MSTPTNKQVPFDEACRFLVKLGKAVAASIENDIAAGNSWRVILEDDGKVAWLTREDGVVTEKFDTEPMTTAITRAEADALAIVPDSKEM